MKASVITARDLVERARRIHLTLPTATAGSWGAPLMAASMMGNQLKEEDGSITLRVKGDGPWAPSPWSPTAPGTSGAMSRTPPWTCPSRPPESWMWAAPWEGSLTVIKDLNLKEPYVGTIELLSGEIADDIAAYFSESEQIPTACALGVLVDTDQSIACAGGYLIQLLPGRREEVISAIERGVMEVGAGHRGPEGPGWAPGASGAGPAGLRAGGGGGVWRGVPLLLQP